ncbi:MAG: hypothetical protein AAF443_05865 [Chlamydiota bacterium]
MAIQPIDLTALRRPFARSDKSYRSHVHKYYLDGNNKNIHIRKQAAEAITALLQANKLLCPLFNIESKALENQLKTKTFLVINKEALCLCQDIDVSLTVRKDFIDRYFSTSILTCPVRCSLGHVLEKEYCLFWKKHVGNLCPRGKNHPITWEGESYDDYDFRVESGLKIDKELEADLTQFRNNLQIRKRNEMTDKLKMTFFENKLEKFESQKRAMARNSIISGCEFSGKLGLKLASKEAVFHIVKSMSGGVSEKVAKSQGRKAVKAWAKKVPVVSLVVGSFAALGRIHLAIEAYNEKDPYWYLGLIKALGEVSSGLVGTMPGLGNLISVCIDVGLFTSDLYTIMYMEKDVQIEGDLEQAYSLFNLEKDKVTQQSLKKAYRLIMREGGHIDVSGNKKLPQVLQDHIQVFTQYVNECRDMIKKDQGWA